MAPKHPQSHKWCFDRNMLEILLVPSSTVLLSRMLLVLVRASQGRPSHLLAVWVLRANDSYLFLLQRLPLTERSQLTWRFLAGDIFPAEVAQSQ